MSHEIVGVRWKGLLASFLLVGAGQFFQGRRVIAVSSFLLVYGGLLLTILLFLLPHVPPQWGFLSIGLCFVARLYNLFDAWRPTPRVGWRGWVLIIIIGSVLGGGMYIGMHSVCGFYRVTASGMEPTLCKGDITFCNRWVYKFNEPQRGDLIVFPRQRIVAGKIFLI
jgi:hypothetical protein